ncbi:ARM repeat-containing protein [Hortaea werneckii]|uniref:ARM repeat-containing protein n=1 Tax=Hortaea werneckii TaxID=91943 RepID=A0A3M7F0Y4_HORWE|nr:ARM repeat-containing protein [Hortaea werneckii]RMY82462.1 hypothetical protein D0861_07869 [Hortaea werneckii]
MADSTQPPEQRELSLVGKVEMRIALTDSDQKLEAILKTYLAPLLLKLASEFQSVRNKVITVCQHVNTRTKPETIQLPVAALVKQFKEHQNSLVRHFDLLYIQQGVSRLTQREKADLLPVVISGISTSGSHGAQIFNLLLRLLESFPLPMRGSNEDAQMRKDLEVTDSDAAYLASWLGKFLLFTPQKGTSTSGPGLTGEDYSFLNLQGKEDLWNPAAGGLNLLRTKILAAKLLASGLFDDRERFMPAVIASADTASPISDVGEDMLKRAMPATDLEDENLVFHLFKMYFGESEAPRVKPPLRLKIIGLLNKSVRSTTFANKIMRIVDDGISPTSMDGEDTVMSNSSTSNAGIGREAAKSRTAIFQYINFVARYGSTETLNAIATRVVTRLRDFVENQGWPKPGPNEDLVSRGYAYEVIGILSKAGPRSTLVEDEHPSLDLLRWLFESQARDSSGSSIVVSIEEALSTVLSAMARMELSSGEQSVLEGLLIDQMSKSAELQENKRLRSTRFVAVRFANRCLPYASVRARWIDVLGIGAHGDRAEVREEAERGLSPYWHGMLNGSLNASQPDNIKFPSFDATVSQFFSGRTSDDRLEPFALARQTSKDYRHCFQHMTGFVRRLIFHEAMTTHGITANVDSEWERRIDAGAESDEHTRNAIKQHLKALASDASRPLQILLNALFIGLVENVAGAGNQLADFIALAPNALLEPLVLNVADILPVLQSNDHARRTAGAHVYGVLASHPSVQAQAISTQLKQISAALSKWQSGVGAALNQAHGAIVALGFYFSRASYREQSFQTTAEFQQLCQTVLAIISESREASLKEASYVALGQLCMFNAIQATALGESRQLRNVIDRIYETAKTGDEAAILCLGQMSMVLGEESSEDSDLRYLEEQLYKLHEIRQAEVHFSVGEALSYVASGWRSQALATKLDIEGPLPKGPSRNDSLTRVVDRLLTDSGMTKPALRKAATMWLLCLVQFCGQQAEIQQRLPRFQTAFKRCLGDRDELVQETASRGLGLVYEKGDRRLKDDLVRDLVSSFSSDKQSQLAGNVSADTQLFEPGALPTGDGSVSTYKDIMSLASEVGDSSLVYKFMSMASSNAIWSSRAAFGRFGLSNVLSDSSVDGYLANNPKLYPKLYRYRFDPNSGVQRSMNDIWAALVKDSAATIDKYFDDIMEDLLTSILGKEWRTRQASCAAIADLVQGRSLEKYEGYLERIWTQCFKVLDDIKESVRAAAASLARVLTGVLTRALEADHSSTKNAAAMLKHVLPFILSPSGMESGAQEVQAFAVHTLLEIVKKSSGGTLRPFIPELVERLIGCLSTFEPEAVNYLHLNASKYNLTEQKIDDMRLSSVRSSPLMEAIERCLDLLDDETMQTLQPRLESAMKGAVGLPSKVGSSRILVSLSTRRLAVFRPHADSFLKMIEKVVLDRNETVSSSYAVAAGYMARAASQKQVLRLVSFCKNLYFQSEDDRAAVTPRRAITSGEIIAAVAKHASDKFKDIASTTLPFVFVAKHDPNDQVKEQFVHAWDESVGGSRAVSLYLQEIIELCSAHLDSPQWVLKHTSARAIADTITAVSASETKISKETGQVLWPALEKAQGGKTWEGKETVLKAFVKFVESARPYWESHPDVASAINKIAIREAKRQNAEYRQHSVRCLAQICLARTDADMSTSVFEAVEPILRDELEAEPMDVDGGQNASRGDDRKQDTIGGAVESLFASINPRVLKGSELTQAITRTLGTSAAIPSPSLTVWRSTYAGLKQLLERLNDAGEGGCLQSGSQDPLRRLLFLRAPPTEALRLMRADAIAALVKASPPLASEMRPDVLALLGEETSPAVRDRLAASRGALDM